LHKSPSSQGFQASSSSVMKEVEFRTYHSTWKWTRIIFKKDGERYRNCNSKYLYRY